jgi:putative NADH-flavin reductase
MNILVLGASGQLGRVVVAKLASQGHRVTAFMRSPDSSASRSNVRLFHGDAIDEGLVFAAAEGQHAVVNTIGGGTIRRNTIESDTTRVVLRALVRTTIRRYIAMSAGMVAPVSFVFDNIVRPLF